METSKEIRKSLKEGVVSPEILGMALYSYNKRAKNMRDKEREYRESVRYRQRFNRYYYDNYDNEGKARAKKEEYYQKKEELLKYLHPSAIHLVIRERNEKVYDYEERYFSIDESEVIYENSYYDRELNDEVHFKVVPAKFVEKYLFYDMDDYSFHMPLIGDESNYNLPIVELDDLTTYGREIDELMSVQMCDRIRLGLRDGTLKYMDNNECVAVAA